MSVYLDVQPRLAANAAEQIAQAVTMAVKEAITQAIAGLAFGLSLTEDERTVVEMHRAQCQVRIRTAQGHRGR